MSANNGNGEGVWMGPTVDISRNAELAQMMKPKPAPAPTRTLRDEFAMAALINCSDHMECPRDMADAAYEIADAMLVAREFGR